MTSPSHKSLLLVILYILLSFSTAHAQSAAQCKQRSEKAIQSCYDALAKAIEENNKRAGAGGGQAVQENALIGVDEFGLAAIESNKVLEECKKAEEECSKVCIPSKGKDQKEQQEIEAQRKKCKIETGKGKAAGEGAKKQNEGAQKDAGKTAEKSNEQKKPEGGAPPPPPPPPPSPPPSPTPTPEPTKLPGDVSGAKNIQATPGECSGAGFGAVNPNCVPGGSAAPTTPASAVDPLQAKCQGTQDMSQECINYRAKQALGGNTNIASIPSAGGALAPASAGGGSSGSGGSSGQAKLDRQINIPDVIGQKEGQGLGGVDGAGGFSGYGGAGGGGGFSPESLQLGGGGAGAKGSSGRGVAAASAVASDVGRSPGPSVLSIVSEVIRNRCNAGRFLHCDPRK